MNHEAKSLCCCLGTDSLAASVPDSVRPDHAPKSRDVVCGKGDSNDRYEVEPAKLDHALRKRDVIVCGPWSKH